MPLRLVLLFLSITLALAAPIHAADDVFKIYDSRIQQQAPGK